MKERKGLLFKRPGRSDKNNSSSTSSQGSRNLKNNAGRPGAATSFHCLLTPLAASGAVLHAPAPQRSGPNLLLRAWAGGAGAKGWAEGEGKGWKARKKVSRKEWEKGEEGVEKE